jgi:hypothetical protein
MQLVQVKPADNPFSTTSPIKRLRAAVALLETAERTAEKARQGTVANPVTF